MAEPFTTLTSRAVPMPEADIDTDRILPSRFMQKPRAEGFADYFFHDLRFDHAGRRKPGFVADAPEYRGARILVAGANFGCGSSREQAVYAVVDFGFRAVVAASFGDIFYANALKNGLVPAAIGTEAASALASRCGAVPSTAVTVDLMAMTVSWDNQSATFAIDAFSRELIVTGRDEIAFTLGLIGEIDAFETKLQAAMPWL
jgi:3-isopropylmalate/(R)-2-methylmalate dehydratase small subunit